MTLDVRGYAARIEHATPEGRDRYIDLLRGLAIGAVVLGHWLVTAVFTRDDGHLDGVSVLTVAEWTHWFTWPFQVMPIFFLVGGYANAVSWRRHRDRGGSWPGWVHRRSRRLLRPTAVFVSATIGAVVVSRLAGVDPSLVDQAGWVAGIALWFLAIYIAVAGLTPLTHRLHVRFGLRATAVLSVAVAAGDVARIVTSDPLWAQPNFVLSWTLIHQVGYWWRDGALPSGTARPLLLSLGGAIGLIALVVLGPWPVAMVTVPGAVIQNSGPPSLALLALVAVQVGLALAVAERGRAWLDRPLPWMVVATVNRFVLTLFLWHMVALVLGAAVLHGTGVFPEPPPLSGMWFAWRPLWLATLAVILAVLVAIFAPVERRGGRPVAPRAERPRVAAFLAGVGALAACSGFVRLTLGGLAGDAALGIPLAGASAFAVGTAMTRLAGSFVRQPPPA